MPFQGMRLCIGVQLPGTFEDTFVTRVRLIGRSKLEDISRFVSRAYIPIDGALEQFPLSLSDALVRAVEARTGLPEGEMERFQKEIKVDVPYGQHTTISFSLGVRYRNQRLDNQGGHSLCTGLCELQ